MSRRIRPAVPDDARAIATVHVRSWQAAYRGQLPDEYLDSLSIDEREAMWRSGVSATDPAQGCLIAEESGEVVGFAAFGPARADHGRVPEGTGEIYAIYVSPEAFGTGVGRELLQAATGELRGAGYAFAILWVLESNRRARRFYEIGGWAADGITSTERIDGLNHPIVRYRVDLWERRTPS